MNNVQLFTCVQAMICVVIGIKVNMQGNLSLGKEVVESICHYAGKNILSGRRSLNPPPTEDPITLAVRTALVCKDLEICQNNLQHFVNEYIILLAKAIENIHISETENQNHTFDEQLKQSLEYIRLILEDANSKVEKEDVEYCWAHIIKRINARFQNVANIIKPDTSDLDNINNKISTRDLRHKIVIVTAFIERKYHLKLCLEYKICSKSHECTKALNKLLIHFKTMPDDRIRLFIKHFYQALFDSPIYSHLNEETASEFQIILNDMSYANDTPTKDIMLSVLKTVEARLIMIQFNKILVVKHEILIAHTILSDMDHLFSNHTATFNKFLNKFYDWLASDVQLEKHVRAVLSDIATQISSAEDDLIRKLIDEVKVFLEITVNLSEK